MIKDIKPSLPEIGKIKIGIKGKIITTKNKKEFQAPGRLDHFIITTLERGDDGNFIKDFEIHKEIGEKPKSLDVRLLYDDPDLNFYTSYVCYVGKKRWCVGDGLSATRADISMPVTCPCKKLAPGGNCKPSGILSVILKQSPMVGGVWKLRTTSFNSIRNIMSSFALISRVTGGVLAGIPLSLILQKKSTTIPNTDRPTTVHIIGIVYRGTISELAEHGQKIAVQMASNRARIEHIEGIARKNIANEIYTENETDDDIVEEFYPEEVMAESGETAIGMPEKKNDPTEPFEDLVDKYASKLAEEKEIKQTDILIMVNKFCAKSAKFLGTLEIVEVKALDDFDDFWQQFLNWSVEQEWPKTNIDKSGKKEKTADNSKSKKAEKQQAELQTEIDQTTIKKPTEIENESKLLPGLSADERLAAFEKIHTRIETLAESILNDVANNTGLTWDECKSNVGMAEEYITYCLAIYKGTGDIKTLIPEGLEVQYE